MWVQLLFMVATEQQAFSYGGTDFSDSPPSYTSYGSLPYMSKEDEISASFHPSTAVIIGVLVTIFSLMFLLLLCAKHCSSRGSNALDSEDMTLPPQRERDVGLDRSVIEALPVFCFSSLEGMKEGLECAVCLSTFEDTETLKLLPKCKHAFHVSCVDVWLYCHPTCPLCRHLVGAHDVEEISSSTLKLDVLNVEEKHSAEEESRSSFDRSLRLFLRREEGDMAYGKLWHEIVVSDVVVRHRWSDFLISDLMPKLSHEAHHPSLPSANDSTPSIPHGMSVDAKETTENKAQNGMSVDAKETTENKAQKLVLLPPYYQRSHSYFSGMQNSNRNIMNNVESNERTREWFTIAAERLKWLVNRDKAIDGVEQKV